jgi:hypothetical protein
VFFFFPRSRKNATLSASKEVCICAIYSWISILDIFLIIAPVEGALVGGEVEGVIEEEDAKEVNAMVLLLDPTDVGNFSGSLQ